MALLGSVTTRLKTLPPPAWLLAILASLGGSVPVMVGWLVATGWSLAQPATGHALVTLTVPLLLLVGLGYAGLAARRLGTTPSRTPDLGSYHLIQRIGGGGMGEVWRAQHLLLARPAAIKLIRPALVARSDTADVVRRFEREARVTAQLRSPHTVDLWDFGRAADGGFYYVMELLDGMDLETLVTRHGPVPPERAVYLLTQVCHSLAEAEANGLVHRDIKPSNIFVCRYGGDHDFVKVLDFGIVKATDPAAVETGVPITSAMLLQGTPAYIAPEQALGSPALDGRADIYATGCVAYWLLTGQLVFTADTAMGILLHHAHTAPTPPSARTELPIPPAFEALILSCLAKDPRERPQSARELARRLARVCDATWTDEKAGDWWCRHDPPGVVNSAR